MTGELGPGGRLELSQITEISVRLLARLLAYLLPAQVLQLLQYFKLQVSQAPAKLQVLMCLCLLCLCLCV